MKCKNLLKSLICSLTLILSTTNIFAQQVDTFKNDWSKPRDFHFIKLTGEPISNMDIPKGKPVLIMYYRPDCGHCRLDAEKLPELLPWYTVPLWMVSPMDVKSIEAYISDFNLQTVEGVTFMRDDARLMHQLFQFDSVPFIVLVDKKGRVIKNFENLPTGNEIKAVLQASEDLK